MSKSNAYEERERMSTEMGRPSSIEKAKLEQELQELDAQYTKAPSQELLNKRLNLLAELLKR